MAVNRLRVGRSRVKGTIESTFCSLSIPPSPTSRGNMEETGRLLSDVRRYLFDNGRSTCSDRACAWKINYSCTLNPDPACISFGLFLFNVY